jgi:hypothetical protein
MDNYKTIPVLLQNDGGIQLAKVDVDDYDNIMKFAPIWRLTTNGYARATKQIDGKYKMFYMHAFVFGDRARHINGDRLDNRRQNLVAVTKKRRRPPSQEEGDFKISRPAIVSEECVTFNNQESSLDTYSGYAIIHYRKRKHYSGLVDKGRPSGYGILYEQECQQASMGMWEHGNMIQGMVLHYRPLPTCMCQEEILCPIRVVERVEVVKEGFRVT